MQATSTLPAPQDRPDCPDCAAANEDITHCIYHATCLGCVARMIAHSPEAWRAVRQGEGEGVAARIREVWGDRYAEGRKAVLAWLRKIESAREKRANSPNA